PACQRLDGNGGDALLGDLLQCRDGPVVGAEPLCALAAARPGARGSGLVGVLGCRGHGEGSVTVGGGGGVARGAVGLRRPPSAPGSSPGQALRAPSPRAGEGKGGRKEEARSNGCLTWACRGQHTRAYAMARGRWPAAPANAYPVDAA